MTNLGVANGFRSVNTLAELKKKKKLALSKLEAFADDKTSCLN